MTLNGMVSRIVSRFKASEAPPYPGTGTDTAGSGVWHIGNWDGSVPGTRIDYASEIDPAWQNAVVSLGLSWLSDNFSEPPLEVVRENAQGEEEPVEDNPLLDLLAQPNEYCDGDALWGATVLSYVCAGNAYWIKQRADNGEVVALWWAPHWCIRPGHDPTRFYDRTSPPTGYVYRVGAMTRFYPPEDIVHFRNGLDPYNPYLGVSQLAGVTVSIYADTKGDTFTASLLRNHGSPSVILSPAAGGLPLTLGPDESAALKARWLAETTGDKSGGPIVSSNALEIQQVNHTPEQMALDTIRQYPEARICAALGLPPMVLGLMTGLEHATYSNMSEAQKAAYVNALIPMQQRFSNVVTAQLLLADGFGLPGDRLRWDYSKVPAMTESQDDLAARASVLKKARILTTNEARGMIGLEPIDGGDELDAIPTPMGFGGAPQDQGPPPPSARSSTYAQVYGANLNLRRVEYERMTGNGNGNGHGAH